jgi:hypothetical protein
MRRTYAQKLRGECMLPQRHHRYITEFNAIINHVSVQGEEGDMQMQQQIAAATVQYTSHQFRQSADLCVYKGLKIPLYLLVISTPLSTQTRLWTVMNVTILAT